MMLSLRRIAFLAFIIDISSSSPLTARDVDLIARDVTAANAEETYAALQQWYDQSTGLWADQWWNSGSCLSTIADLAAVDGNVKNDIANLMANSFSQAQNTHKGFIDDYYDDDGWWSLAWIAAYDLTGNAQYLSAAESIFSEMQTTFGQTPCSKGEGGIWWDKSHTYINAIPNELFLSIAAHLANRAANGKYKDLAQKQWDWFQGSGLINSGGTINDGLDTASCKNSDGVVWSYNQGVILGGLVELASATGDSSLLSTANTLASAAISKLSSNGILHEPCESYAQGCDSDRTQFKGIFVRNLMKLQRAGGGNWGDFFQRNAQSVWENGSDGKGVLGVNWAGPFSGGNASTTCSGLDVLVAALGS